MSLKNELQEALEDVSVRANGLLGAASSHDITRLQDALTGALAVLSSIPDETPEAVVADEPAADEPAAVPDKSPAKQPRAKTTK